MNSTMKHMRTDEMTVYFNGEKYLNLLYSTNSVLNILIGPI